MKDDLLANTLRKSQKKFELLFHYKLEKYFSKLLMGPLKIYW